MDEAELVYDLQKGLGKEILDVDMLENAMRELDKKGDYIFRGRICSPGVQYPYGKMVRFNWMEPARTTRVSSCSILKFIKMLRAPTGPIHNLNFERGYFT